MTNPQELSEKMQIIANAYWNTPEKELTDPDGWDHTFNVCFQKWGEMGRFYHSMFWTLKNRKQNTVNEKPHEESEIHFCMKCGISEFCTEANCDFRKDFSRHGGCTE